MCSHFKSVIKRYTTIPFKSFIYINFIMKKFSIFKRKLKTLGVFSSVHSEAIQDIQERDSVPQLEKCFTFLGVGSYTPTPKHLSLL